MPIANFFIVRILNYIRRETEHDEDDIDMIRFSLEAILWETEKTIYLFFIFLAAGYVWQFLAVMISVLTIRPNAGGFHSSTVWGCFFWTLLGFVLAIFILPLIPLNNIVLLIVAVFSVMVTYIASPLRSKQMERIAKKEKDKRRKITVTVITVLWFGLLFFHLDHFLASPVVCGIFLQNFQLLIEYLKRRHEKRVLLDKLS